MDDPFLLAESTSRSSATDVQRPALITLAGTWFSFQHQRSKEAREKRGGRGNRQIRRKVSGMVATYSAVALSLRRINQSGSRDFRIRAWRWA